VAPGPALAPIREALGRAQPVLIFVAGPNGSGKSTFFNEYLGDLGLPYVNPDLFATKRREAAPDASSEEVERRAFTEAEETRDALLEAGISFRTETVFSDPYRAKVGFLERTRVSGYAVFLIFIGLDRVDLVSEPESDTRSAEKPHGPSPALRLRERAKQGDEVSHLVRTDLRPRAPSPVSLLLDERVIPQRREDGGR
jgi:hypothetical protein